MATKATILDMVKSMCRTDTPDFISPSLEVYLEEALSIYSRDKPYKDVQDVVGSAAKLQATPSDWAAEFSTVTKVVYPWQDEDSTVLEADEYEVDTVPVSGAPVEKIRFQAHEPAATETVRVWYNRPHDLDDSTCTVFAQDDTALAHLVCARIEMAKASYFLGLKDQGLSVDLVDYGAKANEARSLAKMHLDAYRAGLGLADEGPAPAAVYGDIDTDPQYPVVSHQRHHRAKQR